MTVGMALHALWLMTLPLPGVSRVGTRRLSRQHGSGEGRICSWTDSDRYWPNYGGCCAGLFECVEKRPRQNSAYCDHWHPQNEKTCWSHIVMCRKSCGKPNGTDRPLMATNPLLGASEAAAATAADFQSDDWTKWTFHQGCEYMSDDALSGLNSFRIRSNLTKANTNYSKSLAYTSGADMFYTKDAFSSSNLAQESATSAVPGASNIYYLFVNLGLDTDTVPVDKYQLKCEGTTGGTWIRNSAKFEGKIWLDGKQRDAALDKLRQLQGNCQDFLGQAIAESVWDEFFKGAQKDKEVAAAWDAVLSVLLLPIGLFAGPVGNTIGSQLTKVLTKSLGNDKFMSFLSGLGFAGEKALAKLLTIATDENAQSSLGEQIVGKVSQSLHTKLRSAAAKSYAERNVKEAQAIGRVLLETGAAADMVYHDLLRNQANLQILIAIAGYEDCSIADKKKQIDEYIGNRQMRDGLVLEECPDFTPGPASGHPCLYHAICPIDGHWHYANLESHEHWNIFRRPTWSATWHTRIQGEYVDAARDVAKTRMTEEGLDLDPQVVDCYYSGRSYIRR